ncbi:hypothetical protein BC938DRAFT_471151 [Jimgerdemannia flammicorona]|uniref:Uncharacterized protein n=1 Tax=Jimgerdemannia flammicorona TaxID=994334 RepID=A0A433Q8R1_9FUNG|nr:hypothetical protein BC938DRAFT_471151 [Jimgerdemannia flammicorona]
MPTKVAIAAAFETQYANPRSCHEGRVAQMQLNSPVLLGEIYRFNFFSDDGREGLMHGPHGALVLANCSGNCLVLPMTSRRTPSRDELLFIPGPPELCRGTLDVCNLTFIPAQQILGPWELASETDYHKCDSQEEQLKRMRASFPMDKIGKAIKRMLGYSEQKYSHRKCTAGRLVKTHLSYPDHAVQYAIILSAGALNDRAWLQRYFVMPIDNYRGKIPGLSDVEHIDICEPATDEISHEEETEIELRTYTVKVAELVFDPLITQCQWVRKNKTKLTDICIPHSNLLKYRRMIWALFENVLPVTR